MLESQFLDFSEIPYVIYHQCTVFGVGQKRLDHKGVRTGVFSAINLGYERPRNQCSNVYNKNTVSLNDLKSSIPIEKNTENLMVPCVFSSPLSFLQG